MGCLVLDLCWLSWSCACVQGLAHVCCLPQQLTRRSSASHTLLRLASLHVMPLRWLRVQLMCGVHWQGCHLYLSCLTRSLLVGVTTTLDGAGRCAADTSASDPLFDRARTRAVRLKQKEEHKTQLSQEQIERYDIVGPYQGSVGGVWWQLRRARSPRSHGSSSGLKGTKGGSWSGAGGRDSF
jgi:hypothetical protein